jgi:spore germination cell wall hydrolase CwlJ-like protein
VRALLENWRYRISFAWYCLDKGAVAFYALLPLPFALLAVVAYFLHEDFELVHAGHERAVAEAVAARDAELTCLAENVYHEARGEPLAGQYAVAEVTMNRVASSLFPKSVCEVVHEKRWDALRKREVGAFSWTELDSLRQPRGAAWEQAIEVATAVYDGTYTPSVPNALYYHAKYIKPSWAKPNRRVATIGSHVFYR